MNKYMQDRYQAVVDCLPADDAEVLREAVAVMVQEANQAGKARSDVWGAVVAITVVAVVAGLAAWGIVAETSADRITLAVRECKAEQQELKDRCLECLLEK